MRLLTIILAITALTSFLFINEGGKTMAQQSAASKKSIPPIDKSIPAEIETATFALG